MWMGDIKAVKIAFLINQPFLLIYFPYAHLPVCPHECFFFSFFLATAYEVVRRSCWRKDNGLMLGIHLLPPILALQLAFIMSLSPFELSTV